MTPRTAHRSGQIVTAARPADLRVGGVTSGRDLAWQDLAACAQTDPALFFPEKGDSTRPARLVCRGCEVRAHCLEYAQKHALRWGIWGDTSERERRRMRQQRSEGVAA